MFGGILPAILPVIRSRFVLSLSAGVFVLTVFNIVCNFVQILTGGTRKTKNRPVGLVVGLVLGAAICFFPAFEGFKYNFAMLIFLAVVSSTGVAIMHPEGLRAIHNLDKISASVSSAIFMSGGFIGFAGGGMISSALVSAWGLKSLYFLLILPVAAILLVVLSKVRLATEKPAGEGVAIKETSVGVNFWLVFIMSLPATFASTVIIGLMPTHLNELGFELTFGGLTSLVFGAGSAAGSFFWAWRATKKGDIPTIITALFAGVPFLFGHIFFAEYRWAIAMLGVGAFCSAASYPLVVALAMKAGGVNLGQRMGFIVGGSWGIASIMFLLTGLLAERTGVGVILKVLPGCYFASAMFGLIMLTGKRGVRDERQK
jgi:MFS family permease